MTGHFWVPAEDARHAVAGDRLTHAPGDAVTALCGVEVVCGRLRSADDPAWRVSTCSTCWSAAKGVVRWS
jgi:hypothetical protein